VLGLAAAEGRIVITRNSRDFAPLLRDWAEAPGRAPAASSSGPFGTTSSDRSFRGFGTCWPSDVINRYAWTWRSPSDPLIGPAVTLKMTLNRPDSGEFEHEFDPAPGGC
jgi:hypothetical protein